MKATGGLPVYEIQLRLKRGYFGAVETSWVLREVNWRLWKVTCWFREVTSVLGEVIYGHGLGR